MGEQLIKATKHQLLVLDRLTLKEVGNMLAMGFSNRFICGELRVSVQQIAKVIHANPMLKRRFYRDGISPVAKAVTQRVRKAARDYCGPMLAKTEAYLTTTPQQRRQILLAERSHSSEPVKAAELQRQMAEQQIH